MTRKKEKWKKRVKEVWKSTDEKNESVIFAIILQVKKKLISVKMLCK